MRLEAYRRGGSSVNSEELHRVLANFYRDWRGRDAPVDSWTERMWVEIEFSEIAEGVSG